MKKVLKMVGICSGIIIGIFALIMIFVPPSYNFYDY